MIINQQAFHWCLLLSKPWLSPMCWLHSLGGSFRVWITPCVIMARSGLWVQASLKFGNRLPISSCTADSDIFSSICLPFGCSAWKLKTIGAQSTSRVITSRAVLAQEFWTWFSRTMRRRLARQAQFMAFCLLLAWCFPTDISTSISCFRLRRSIWLRFTLFSNFSRRLAVQEAMSRTSRI